MRQEWTPKHVGVLREMNGRGCSLAEIAAALPGRSVESVRNARRRYIGVADGDPNVWSDAELATARDMTARGATADEVAAALPGRTAGAVRCIRSRRRWSSPVRGRPRADRAPVTAL